MRFPVFLEQMRGWLRLPFAWLALVAMMVTLLPQTLWACPMTGRVDSAARVCLGVMPLVSGEMPCAHFGGKCCKPLTLPPTQNDDHNQSVAAVVAEKASPFFAFSAPTQSVHPVVVVTPFQLPAHNEEVTLSSFGEPPPSFWIQHRPITCAGRAPPVL